MTVYFYRGFAICKTRSGRVLVYAEYDTDRIWLNHEATSVRAARHWCRAQ